MNNRQSGIAWCGDGHSQVLWLQRVDLRHPEPSDLARLTRLGYRCFRSAANGPAVILERRTLVDVATDKTSVEMVVPLYVETMAHLIHQQSVLRLRPDGAASWKSMFCCADF